MYFETLRSPDETLCPVGRVLTVCEVAQLTERNAAVLVKECAGADALRLDSVFAFKILESQDEAGHITPDDISFAWADEKGMVPYQNLENTNPPLVSLEDLLNERKDDEDEEGTGSSSRLH